MLLVLLLILFILFGLTMINVISHIILWAFALGILIGGYKVLNYVDYKHLIAIGFVLIAVKLVIDSARKKQE
jgi:hypothetical protein